MRAAPGTRVLDLIATVIECCEVPRKPAPGHPPAENVRVSATLRQLARTGLLHRLSLICWAQDTASVPPLLRLDFGHRAAGQSAWMMLFRKTGIASVNVVEIAGGTGVATVRRLGV